MKELDLSSLVRKALLPVFSRINPGDIRIRNHHTGDRLRLHSFRHKGYWFHGRRRESATMELFKRLIQPGDRVVEVGGHIGYISQVFAGLVAEQGQVVVFEPGPNNLPYLRQNVGGMSNVTIEPMGVGAVIGSADFYIESLTGQNNSFVPDFDGLSTNADAAGIHPTVKRVLVEVTTLDAYFMGPGLTVNFVKVDVEGFELSVLEGSLGLLRGSRPMLMVEIQANYAEIESLAREAGYDVFDENLEPIDWISPPRGNTFWFHRESHARTLASLRE